MIVPTLSLAAAANAALLATALAYRSWSNGSVAGLYAAGFLIVCASAVSLIVLDHAGVIATGSVTVLLEGALTLLAGPLLLLFVAALLGVPTVAHAGLGLVLVHAIGFILMPTWFAEHVRVERLIFVQVGFTLWAGWIVFGFRPSGRRATQVHSIAIAVVAAMGALHVAQLARTFFSGVDLLVNVVPLTGALAFLALSVVVFLGGRITALEPLTEVKPSASEFDSSLAATLTAKLQAGLLKDPNLTVQKAADDVGTSGAKLSQAVQLVYGRGFPEYVQELRILEAKRLLSDPKEVRTSMEAIGMLSGFGSRSAFYQAFRRQTGMTPAAFRSTEGGNGVQKAESAQGRA